MMKRLAAAVVAAFVNLLSSASPNASADAMASMVTSADDDGPDAPDTIEYRRSEGTGGGRPVVLAMASAVCGEPIDGAWLVRHADGGPVVAVAAQLRPDHVAMLDVVAAPALLPPARLSPLSSASVDPSEPLQRALAFCRERGALTVIVNTAAGAVPAGAVRRLADSNGFQFTRGRRVDGADVIELYTDLYWTAEHAVATPRPSHHSH